MFRTEVVKSKNLRKSPIFIVYNVVAITTFTFIMLMLLNVFGDNTSIGKFINENYNNVVKPIILGVAFVVIIFSNFMRSRVKSPLRLGSLEIDENKMNYLIDDEIKETIAVQDIKAINFEFYSFRMRGNPMGCMNYLTIDTKNGEKKYEILVANSMVKAELGELLNTFNTKFPVKVTYALLIRKLIGDKDFKFN